MKNMKNLIMISGLLGMLCLTACGQDQNAAAGTPSDAEIIYEGAEVGSEDAICENSYRTDADLPVSMKTQYPAYLPDTQTITAEVTNRTDSEINYAESAFTLFRIVNGKEEKIPYKKDGDYFTELACICPPQGTSQFTADLAAHYDLPLEEGVYLIRVGDVSLEDGLCTGFEISADAAYVQQEQAADAVSVTVTSTDADALNVTVQNNADTPNSFSLSGFGIEQTDEMTASFTPYHGEDSTFEIPPHESKELTLQAAQFGNGSAFAAGQYTLVLNNTRADFEIKGE